MFLAKKGKGSATASGGRVNWPNCQPANIALPDFYSDNMVLQMGPNPHRIWGYTDSKQACITVMETCQDTSYGKLEQHTQSSKTW